MAQATVWISFAVDGKPLRLGSESQWRAAVRNGDLRADTPVIIEQGGDRIYAGPASDAGPLADYFETPTAPTPAVEEPRPLDAAEQDSAGDTGPQALGSPAGAVAAGNGFDLKSEPDEEAEREAKRPPSKPEGAPVVRPGETGVIDTPVNATSRTRAPISKKPNRTPGAGSSVQIAERPNVREDGPSKVAAPKDEPPNASDVFVRLIRNPIAWAVALVALIMVLASTCSSPGSLDEGAASEQREGGAAAVMYVGRQINVRAAASRDAPTVGLLRRGEQLEGIWRLSEGETWFEITAGSHAGQFVWGGNLVPQAPPPIAGEASVEEVIQAANVLAEPRAGARIMSQVSEGQSVEVLGFTADGWAEVAIERLGVGYVPTAAFRAITEEASADETAELDSASQPDQCRTATTTEDGAIFEQIYCRRNGEWLAVGQPVLVRRAPSQPPERSPEQPQPTQPISPTPTVPQSPPAQPSRSTPPANISRPNWLQQPGFAEFNRVVPERALDEGQQGVAGLSCRVGSDGRLQDCMITSETPSGWGFGRAALRMVPSFRMAGTDLDGYPTAGRTVRFNITFAFEDE